MDWGIVASIMVALALFILAMMTVCGPVVLLMALRMRKKMRAGGISGCPMPCGPSRENIEPAASPCTSQVQ